MKEVPVLRRGPKPDSVFASIPRILLLRVSPELQVEKVGLNNWYPADCNCQLNKPETQEHMFAYKILINFTDWDKNILVLGFRFHA